MKLLLINRLINSLIGAFLGEKLLVTGDMPRCRICDKVCAVFVDVKKLFLNLSCFDMSFLRLYL